MSPLPLRKTNWESEWPCKRDFYKELNSGLTAKALPINHLLCFPFPPHPLLVAPLLHLIFHGMIFSESVPSSFRSTNSRPQSPHLSFSNLYSLCPPPSFTHSLTHPLTHSVTHTPTHPVTHSRTHSLPPSLLPHSYTQFLLPAFFFFF